MGRTLKSLAVLAFLVCCTAYAQKGIGTPEGTTQNPIPIDLVEFTGVAQHVEEGPCPYVLGKSMSGMHLTLITAEEQEIDVHLGPVWAVSIWTEGIEGQTVKLVAFRTQKLPENHFIAKELEWDGQKAVFRDGYLKPFWANRHEREIW